MLIFLVQYVIVSKFVVIVLINSSAICKSQLGGRFYIQLLVFYIQLFLVFSIQLCTEDITISSYIYK